MELEQLVPQILERRIHILTRTKNVWDTLERLCEMGYCELAMVLLSYIASAGEATSAFTPYPLSDKLLSCKIIREETILYVIVNLEREGQKDEVCIAINNIEDDENYYVRPCTCNEIETLIGKHYEPENHSKTIPKIIDKANTM